MKSALLVIFLHFLETIAAKELFCFHQVLTSYKREGDERFSVDDINPNLCTHLVYGYFGITDDGYLQSKIPDIDYDQENVFKFNNLKNINKNLKTLIAIGGWEDESSPKYSLVASDPKKRQNFIESTIEFLKKYKFDGIALHWCFPGMFGGDIIYDKINFSRWLEEIQNAFNNFQSTKPILMTMVQGIIENPELSYEIARINLNVDYIYLTTYDFYGSWRDHVGIPSGLYRSPKIPLKFTNADYMVKDWIRKGASPTKIIMAIPFFGRQFTLVDPKKNELGAKFDNSVENGITISYARICRSFKHEEWDKKWDSDAMGPYCRKDYIWIGYEDKRSIKAKTEYIIKNELAGAAVFVIEDDDFLNTCEDGRYPLLNAVANGLGVVKSLDTSMNETFNVSPSIVTQVNIQDKYPDKPNIQDKSSSKHKYILNIQILRNNMITGSTEVVFEQQKKFKI